MSRDVPAKMEGFTPIFDTLVLKYNIYTAVVFGRVYRFCQMKDGKCTASLATLMEGSGLSRSTFQRSLDILVRDGYLTERVSKIPKRPHIYRDTGKAGLKVTVAAFDEEEVSEEPAVAQGPEEKHASGGTEDASPGTEPRVSEKRQESIKKLIGEGEAEKSPPPATPQMYAIAQAIAKVTGMDLTLNHGIIFGFAKALSKANPPATAELILQQYNGNPDSYWRSQDWRGKKGEAPDISSIRKTWGKWASSIAPPAEKAMTSAEAVEWAKSVHVRV